MAHRHDRLDASLANVGDRPTERHGLGAYRHATQIGVEIDAGINASVTRAQRCADLLPVVTITPSDRVGGGDDQLLIALAQH